MKKLEIKFSSAKGQLVDCRMMLFFRLQLLTIRVAAFESFLKLYKEAYRADDSLPVSSSPQINFNDYPFATFNGSPHLPPELPDSHPASAELSAERDPVELSGVPVRETSHPLIVAAASTAGPPRIDPDFPWGTSRGDFTWR